MPLFTQAPDSLCIVRLSAIGDCVHTVAVVQAIQRQWPQTRITWIMGKVEAMLLGDLPGIEVIPFVAGDLGGIIRAWSEGRLARPLFAMPGCRGRRRMRGRGRCGRGFMNNPTFGR